MSVILLTNDLMVVSHVEGAAARNGVTVKTVSNTVQASDWSAAGGARLVILDLAAPSLDVAALVEQFKPGGSSVPRIIAFGPHVQEDRLAAAQQAGCDHVVSRGQFFSQIDTLLQE